MKALFLVLFSSLTLGATPLLESWFTDLTGRYARIYPDNAAQAAQTPVTTWNRGDGVQEEPAYAEKAKEELAQLDAESDRIFARWEELEALKSALSAS